MREYYFYYRLPGSADMLRIKGKRRPSLASKPKRGTWVVSELQNRDGSFGYAMPSFPEITWGRLRELIYIGKEAISTDGSSNG